MAASDRVVMISGASRGIGAAIAEELRARGWRLSLGVRSVEATAAAYGGPAEDLFVHPWEARDPTCSKTWTAATLDRFGRIDAVVANAGIATFVGLEDGEPDDLDDLFAVDVKAPFLLARATLPALRVGGSGRFVAVASLSGKRVLGLNAGYQMAKHAVVALAHAVRRAGWADGVRATALCPGFVATDLTAQVTDPPPEAMSDPHDIARLVATTIELPNSASVAELLVNCRWEHSL